MRDQFILALDQGTTGTRAILYTHRGLILSSSYREFRQFYPKPGWVEHDPEEIWKSVQLVVKKAITDARIKAAQIGAIGITNQRETVVVWDRKSGKPLHRALVWQDRRTSDMTDHLKRQGHEKSIRTKTGLVLDPYFSASKISWLLNNVSGLRKKAAKGDLLFGTIDTWLLFKLTGGLSHKTDFTNASRTLLYDIRKKRWDPDLLKLFQVPGSMLPEVVPSGGCFGETLKTGVLPDGIPVMAMIGDQQAALYGQGCYHKGEMKNTYGTGCFVVLNMGTKTIKPPFGLLVTLACDMNGRPVYALEGAVFIAGALMQWLRDGLRFYENASESERIAVNAVDTHGVTIVPAFTGLASPHWRPEARGMISGLTRGVRREHIVRAALESIAHQSADVIDLMKKHAGRSVKQLKVDGGATANAFLMQVQADLLGMPVHVSDMKESTAWGAAKLAGFASGLWPDLDRIDRNRRYRVYHNKMKPPVRNSKRLAWKHELERVLI